MADTQYFVELFGKLGNYHRRVLKLYGEGLSDNEIICTLNISYEQLEVIRKQIGLYWMNYDPDIRERYE